MRLAILGASGHGKVAADAAGVSGWTCVEFFDDAWPEISQNGPWPVVGNTSVLIARLGSYDGVFVAIGNNAIRQAKHLELAGFSAPIVTLVHPTSCVSTHASLAEGSIVLANAVVNACASVGVGCIVNTGAVVEHDCILGDFSHVSPNATLAGGAALGPLAWVGAGASIRQMIVIGENVLVGMGAVVTKDISDGAKVVGNPAKEIT